MNILDQEQRMREQQFIEHIKSALAYEGDLTEESELFSTGALDSVDMMKLIMFVENTAGIQVRAEDVTLDNFDTVSRIVRYVDQQR
jgi:acyl carrier protein